MMRIRCVSSPYTITTPYGQVKGYPLNNGFHTGVDYISDGRILSPQDSVVTAIGKDSVNGNYLVLESNGYRDWFSHIKDGGYKVHANQSVKRGQHIADQGETGSASGIHVHHSLRVNGVMADPEKHLNEGVVMVNEPDEAAEIVRAIFKREPSGNEVNDILGRYWKERIVYLRTLPAGREAEAKVQNYDQVVRIKDNEITRLTDENTTLRSQMGETTKWQTLRALLRELLGIK